LNYFPNYKKFENSKGFQIPNSFLGLILQPAHFLFSSSLLFFFVSAHSPAQHQPTLASRPSTSAKDPCSRVDAPLLTARHRLPTAEPTPCPCLCRLCFTPHLCLPRIPPQCLASFLRMVATESKRIEAEGLSPTETHQEIFHKSTTNS
jgi:hypothetical protein